MSIVNINFKIDASAAMVLALFFGWAVPGIGEMPTGFKNWGQWGLWIWGCTPFLISMALVLLSKLGLLQRFLFGTVYKDFQSGRPLTTDLELVRARLGKWRTGSHPSLQWADAALERWGGPIWTGEGLWRCIGVAVVYPLLVLWLVWALTGSGSLGTAVVLPVDVPALQRWGVVATFIVTLALMVLGCSLILNREGTLRHLDNGPQLTRTLATLLTSIPSTASALVGLSAFLLPCVGTFVIVFFFIGVTVTSLAISAAVAGASSIASVLVLTVTRTGIGATALGLFLLLPLSIALSLSLSLSAIEVGITGGALAVGVIGAVAFVSQNSKLKLALQRRWFAISTVLALFLITSAVTSLLPMLPHLGVPMKSYALQPSSSSFFILLFFGFAPLLNGLSDWLSINITRSLLQRYCEQARRGSVSGWQFHALDIGSALVLTVILYAVIVGVLLFMQRAGWQVDVRDMMLALKTNPWTGSAQWLLLMALANLLPTLFHLGLWLTAAAWSRDVKTHTNLSEVMAQMTRDRLAGARPAQPALLPGDGATQMFVYVLKIQPWLDRLVVFGLIVLSVVGFTALVPACADWALRWLP